ncbi:GGDEF domain-containing response regulator [Alteromonas sp. a30]|uniref:GGDEF domain-containing response regulator n=1 Tax=Alteromonas sp. a30 TaxID=2730917 RepID=UPI00227F1F88|nr:diguanylate cyclase [Alteromonas sp. a30]MCY7295639.1 diguanylate cyclase [Alteromonas sp. a30]
MLQELADKPTILLVDDEKANLKILTDLLKPNAKTLVAKSGAQALQKAKDLFPDIILLDVVMPDMDGFEVIKKLKSDPSTQSIPVIFITGLTDVNFEEKGLELGACDYIQKPFHAAIVRARVQLHLQLLRQRRMLEELALIDPLTTIANRRKFEQVIDIELRSAMRTGEPLSIAVIDIDFFKQFNDTAGHSAGDMALAEVANGIQSQLKRPRDFVARIGGEEFVVVLPNTDSVSADMLLNQCRSAVASLKIPHPTATPYQVVTISSGGITCKPSSLSDKDDILNRADNMLYEAKNTGRNQVLWDELPN